MVDLLKKPTGFRVDKFALMEDIKREREKPAVTALVESQEPLWKPDDPRWLMNPPYGFIPFTLRFGGRCVYCGDPIAAGERELYSRKIQSVAHRACYADFDRLPARVAWSPPEAVSGER